MGRALYADGRPDGRLVQLFVRGLSERFADAGRREAMAGKSGSRRRRTWPAEPYKLVWQVRANGTHRILPVYNPDGRPPGRQIHAARHGQRLRRRGPETRIIRSRRAIISPTRSDAYCDWTHERDWMYLNLWGRLGYDPDDARRDVRGHGRRQARAGRDAARRGLDGGEPDRLDRVLGLLARARPPQSRDRARMGRRHGRVSGGRAVRLACFQVDQRRTWPTPRPEASDGRISSAAKRRPRSRPTRRRRGQSGRDPADSRARRPSRSDSRNSSPPAARPPISAAITPNGSCRPIGQAKREAGKPRTPRGKRRSHMQEAEKEWAAARGLSFLQAVHRAAADADQRLSLVAGAAEDQGRGRAAGQNRRARRRSHPAPPPSPRLLRRSPSRSSRGHGEDSSLPAAGITRAWALVKPLPSSAFFHKAPMIHTRRPVRIRVHTRAVGPRRRRRNRARRPRPPRSRAGTPTRPISSSPRKPGPTPLLYSSEEALTYLDPAVLSPDGPRASSRFVAGLRISTGRSMSRPAQNPRRRPARA